MRQTTSITGCVLWPVGRSVGWSVPHSFDDPYVAPYWPSWPCLYIDHPAKPTTNQETNSVPKFIVCPLGCKDKRRQRNRDVRNAMFFFTLIFFFDLMKDS